MDNTEETTPLPVEETNLAPIGKPIPEPDLSIKLSGERYEELLTKARNKTISVELSNDKCVEIVKWGKQKNLRPIVIYKLKGYLGKGMTYKEAEEWLLLSVLTSYEEVCVSQNGSKLAFVVGEKLNWRYQYFQNGSLPDCYKDLSIVSI